MNIILFFTINSYINLQNNNINIYDKYKKVHSLSVTKRKINKYIFNLDDNILNISEDKNTKTIDQNKLDNKYSFNKKEKVKIDETPKKNLYINDKDLDQYLIEKDKKISLLIEDFIQQNEAEIQIKQKIINMQYNIILLYNKIENNLSFKKNNSEDKIQLINLKKLLEKNIEAFNEISEKNKKFIKKYIENGVKGNERNEIELNYLQKKYVYMIFKNTKIQKENIEIKLKYKILKNEKENDINYIEELENQIKLRDLIIKELLFLDNILTNNNKRDIKMNPVFSNILKYEKNNYKTFSELQNKSIYNKIKNKRKNNYSTNRPRSISINNKSNISNNTIFKENSNHSNDKEYIIDLDKSGSKINNSYLKLKIPSLTKSNSSLNIHNFNNYKTNFKNIENQKLKFNSRKNNNNAKEYLYENNKDSNNINCKNTDNEIENSSNKIKSMLKEIKNMNTDISSKFSMIENQTNRNQLEISGQIQKNFKFKEKIFKKINSNNKNKSVNKATLNKNIIIDNDLNNKEINYSINCQIINNNILNNKNFRNKKCNSTKKLLKSENSKNNKIRIFDSNKSKPITTLEKILLSRGNTTIKKNKKEVNKEEISKIKNSLLNQNNHFNKSYINNSSKNTINA